VIRALVIVALAAGTARADDWEVRVPAEAEVTAASAATVSLTIAGLRGKVISKDGPIRIELSSPTLELPQPRYERRHAADPAADAPRFDLALVANDAGDHELTIAIRFWVCGARACTPVRTSRTVAVKAPPPQVAAP
jgi:hypothetical protein